MKSFISRLNQFTLLKLVLSLLFGLFLIIQPQIVLQSIIYLLGGYLLLMGTITIINGLRLRENQSLWNYALLTATIYFVSALAVLLLTKPLLKFLPIILGLFIIVNGISKLSGKKTTIKEVNPQYKLPSKIYGCLIILAGCFLLFNPFSSILLLLRAFGGLLIFMGGTELFFLFKNS